MYGRNRFYLNGDGGDDLPEDPELVVLAFILATFIPAVAVAFFMQRRRVGSKETSVIVRDGSEWGLGFVARRGRRYGLCLFYDVRYPGSEDDYGLTAEYVCTAGGVELVSERAHAGDLAPQEDSKPIRTFYRCSHSAVFGNCRSRATVILCTAGPFRSDMEVHCSGELNCAEGTVLEAAEIYFSRR